MDMFDEKIKKLAEEERFDLPDGFEERLRKNLEALPEKKKISVSRVLRAVLIAAAICMAILATAFVSGVIKFEIGPDGNVKLGRFALGYTVDESGFDNHGYQVIGNPDHPINPERILVDSEGTTVIAPVDVEGVEIVVEDGKFMLYYQSGIIEGSRDISEELKENQGYHYYELTEGHKISITVYTTDDPKNGTYFEGSYYRVNVESSLPSGLEFTGDSMHKVSGNCYIESSVVEE